MNSWVLTEEEKNKLTEQDRKKYETAVRYKSHDWANGPFGGWVRGNDLLKELGWTEQIIIVGNRQLVSLIKPLPTV